MALPTIHRGDDKLIVITAKNDGVEIDLDTVNELWCVLTQKGRVMNQYSLNTLAGYDDITLLNQTTDTGKFEIMLQSAETSVGIVGQPIFVEVKVQTAQAGYDDSTFEQIVTKKPLAELEDSHTKDL